MPFRAPAFFCGAFTALVWLYQDHIKHGVATILAFACSLPFFAVLFVVARTLDLFSLMVVTILIAVADNISYQDDDELNLPGALDLELDLDDQTLSQSFDTSAEQPQLDQSDGDMTLVDQSKIVSTRIEKAVRAASRVHPDPAVLAWLASPRVYSKVVAWRASQSAPALLGTHSIVVSSTMRPFTSAALAVTKSPIEPISRASPTQGGPLLLAYSEVARTSPELVTVTSAETPPDLVAKQGTVPYTALISVLRQSRLARPTSRQSASPRQSIELVPASTSTLLQSQFAGPTSRQSTSPRQSAKLVPAPTFLAPINSEPVVVIPESSKVTTAPPKARCAVALDQGPSTTKDAFGHSSTNVANKKNKFQLFRSKARGSIKRFTAVAPRARAIFVSAAGSLNYLGC
ncbi:hypothetical protein DFH08DRAFT_879337 [Mycena albidolilacea]|uniref:Uncharacterized protein n=1 Tax=Mycena albidolilacea TaxID=1033008 RepID=A0AAD6ZR44_9AGAR|nr:hypothetical protein DFH08DRAFT_879337 [Mycena albidolilacea]